MKRQLRNYVFWLAVGTVAFGIISACGGSGGGGLGVARGTGASVGPVSGFGSVFVNGVEFSTEGIPNRVVESNDGITTEGALSEGMILRVQGEWREDGQGTAEKLGYDDTLRGPINLLESDPSGAGEFVTVTVMGQKVRVDRQTIIRGTTFTSLLGGADAGEHLRVSAWRQADGSYRAGYIATISPDLSDVELEGSVTEVSEDLNQFAIGTITVEYDEDNVVFGSGLTEADLSSAKALEVEGSLADSVLTAISIDRDDSRRFARDNSGDIELTAAIEAPYAALGSGDRPGEFTMGGLTIRVTTATELESGLALSDLTTDLLVQVEGNFLSNTVVEAEEISLREANARVKGAIGTIDSATGPLEVGGVTVRMTPLTTLVRDGDSAQASVALVSGTRVEIEGVEKSDASGVYIEALKVEVDNDAGGDDVNKFELEGRLQFISQNPAANGLSILGLTMSDLGAEYDGEDKNTAREAIVSAFYASETVILEVEYSNTPSGFVADEIEREEDDND